MGDDVVGLGDDLDPAVDRRIGREPRTSHAGVGRHNEAEQKEIHSDQGNGKVLTGGSSKPLDAPS